MPVDIPDFKINEELAQQGSDIYIGNCVACHGSGLVSGGGAPDLRESPIALSRDGLKAVLIDGAKVSAGMGKFKELDGDGLDSLVHYIMKVARDTVDQPILWKD